MGRTTPVRARERRPVPRARAAARHEPQVRARLPRGQGDGLGRRQRPHTAEQTETARFWYDAAAREWNLAAQQGLADRSADAWRAAHTLAVLDIALADAVIATFDTKFQENYWRPITAIRAGARDGNPATRGEADWEPLCATSPFPEYPSTHAATGAAAASALALEVGDRHRFTVTNPSGVTRTYRRFSRAAYEEGISRIYCGIHFRTAMNRGFAMGGLIAHHVDATLMRPLDD